MQWPETIELTLGGIAQGGDAVGRWEGRVVFVAGGIPGERVRARLREARDSYARAVVEEVLDPSPDRVPPRVPGADNMPWQHIAYAAQLRFRREILADQLAKIGGLPAAQVAETLPASPPWAYRNSARLHCDGRQVGYYAAETRTIREVESDPLLLGTLDAALGPLRQALAELGGAMGRFEVTLRASETYGYLLAALHGPGAGGPEARRLAARWRELHPPLAGVLIGDAGADAGAEGGRSPRQIGQATLIEELGGITFELHPTTFFQVNLAAAEALLGLVRAGLEVEAEDTRKASLLDLYCGAGTFALPLAGSVAEVVGVEEYGGAIADGRASAELSQITNVRFIQGRAEDVLPRLDGPFDYAVLDPPRRGCHPRALEQLIRLAPRRLVYVSCHPGTLARDLKILTAGGYRLLRCTPVDLFPQTAHVESVSVLSRA
ncbi:MAG: 23S rRNA (uracil(1939)-C(5))-methyltransferase RlmD [Chloroflexota bacterium]